MYKVEPLQMTRDRLGNVSINCWGLFHDGQFKVAFNNEQDALETLELLEPCEEIFPGTHEALDNLGIRK